MKLGDVTYAWEPLAALIDSGYEAMTKAHWEEIGIDRDRVKLNIKWDLKTRQEEAGQLRYFAARRDDELIGYVSFYFEPNHPNYDFLYIKDEVFWLKPEERRGWVGYFLFKYALQALPRPSKVYFVTKIHFEGKRKRRLDAVGMLLKRLGMEPIETVWKIILE